MMSKDQLDQINLMQERIELAARTATTRAEVVNLRALWGDLDRLKRSDVGVDNS